jgi:hypothetical protein
VVVSFFFVVDAFCSWRQTKNEGILDVGAPWKGNPGRMGSSLPRKKHRLLQSAASLPDLIGLDPMRSGNEPGSLHAWSDKRTDKFYLWQFSQWGQRVYAPNVPGPVRTLKCNTINTNQPIRCQKL